MLFDFLSARTLIKFLTNLHSIELPLKPSLVEIRSN
ncbi:hypothetical protein EMIT0P74_90269 [Pseudomonas sp. IT-P74]